MERRKLTREEIDASLLELTGWEEVDGKLHKEFKFGSFAEAIGWLVSVAIYADKIDHHPNWSNVYNRVTVELWTHDLDALSTLDVALAKKMNMLAAA
jgi:4a-hydroxytetrahydrobiopterin dehydratase